MLGRPQRYFSGKKICIFKPQSFRTKNLLHNAFLTSLALSGCGDNDTGTTETTVPIITPEVPSNSITATPEYIVLTPTLSEGTNYLSSTPHTEIISTTNNILKTISLIQDDNTTDADKLNIITSQDMLDTPVISGFEDINLSVGENFTADDNTFDVNLGKISNVNEIQITHSTNSSSVHKVSVGKASGMITFGEGFDWMYLDTVPGENLVISTASNTTLHVSSGTSDLNVYGGGKSLNIYTSNIGDIDISENSSVTLYAQNASENIKIVSNGDVIIQDAGKVTGNINVSAVGEINIINSQAASGKLELENLRALPGSDIKVSNAGNAKSVNIKSTGSVTSTENGGFKNASTLSITAAENSDITISGETEKNVFLNAVNSSSSEVAFNIDIDSITNLALGGSAPISLTCEGNKLEETVVTSTNTASSTINMIGSSKDVSNIAGNIEIRLNNLDGTKTLVGPNQSLVFDTEINQTTSIFIPELHFSNDATSSTSNTISLKTVDTNSSNIDSLVTLAGLVLKDIQILNLNLSESSNFEITNNVVGTDLKTINLTGSGNFNLNTKTIIGLSDGSTALEASNYSGVLTITVDDSIYGLKSITSGSGDDRIKIDSFKATASGVTVNSGAGHDRISLTEKSDGTNAKLTINGGDGNDEINFAEGLDFSSSTFSISGVESLNFVGGANAFKLPSSVISAKNNLISEDRGDPLTIEILPDAQTINLSSLTFDDSIKLGEDKFIIDSSNFSQAMNITGSVMNDEITGTLSMNDTISSGDGNDVIKGMAGNDTLTPGNGVDHITPGFGTDTINLSESKSSVDTIYYAMDAGSGNVDTITNFDVNAVKDIISLDVSAPLTPITYGNGTSASASNAGTIAIYNHSLDTDLNYSSNSSASIIKLIQTDKSSFATALGTSEITVAENTNLCFLWFDSRETQAVFGYVNENTDTPLENKIKAEDAFLEVARLSISVDDYTHLLTSDNFVYI